MGKISDGLFKRGGIWWIRTDPISRKARSTGCRDPKAAKAYRAQRELLASDPAYTASETATLGEWIENLIRTKKTDKSAATIKIYVQKLGHFVRLWGADMPLCEITTGLCDRYVVTRRTEGVTDHTIVKEFSALSQLLKLATRGGCYSGQIALLRPIDVAARYEPRKRALPSAEVIALLRACQPRLKAFCEVSVAFGLRFSEVLKVEPGDLDRTNWVVRIRGTKTKKAKRNLPVLVPFRPLIEDALPHLPLRRYNNIARDLAAACRRAGIDRATPNDLRRSHATLLVEAGVDRDVVRRLLGHSTSTMVERVYGQPRPEALALLAAEKVRGILVTDGHPVRLSDRPVRYPLQGAQTVYSRATLALAQAYADVMSAREAA
jgi:integrase